MNDDDNVEVEALDPANVPPNRIKQAGKKMRMLHDARVKAENMISKAVIWRNFD